MYNSSVQSSEDRTRDSKAALFVIQLWEWNRSYNLPRVPFPPIMPDSIGQTDVLPPERPDGAAGEHASNIQGLCQHTSHLFCARRMGGSSR